MAASADACRMIAVLIGNRQISDFAVRRWSRETRMIPSENSRHWSRRGFVKAAAGAATYAGLAKAVHAKAPGHPFEVVASLYAWELHDEGVQQERAKPPPTGTERRG